MRRALSLAANPKYVDVVAHEVSQIHRHGLSRKRRKANPPAAVDHARRLVQRIGRTRAFEHILHALAAGQAPDCLDRVFVGDIDDFVGTEPLTDLEPSVAGAGQNYRLSAKSFGYPDTH